MCCFMLSLLNPAGSYEQSSAIASTSSSSSFLASVSLLKTGILLPGHFFTAASDTAFLLRKNKRQFSPHSPSNSLN